MTPIQKLLESRHHWTVRTITMILSFPLAMLIGIHLAKWIV